MYKFFFIFIWSCFWGACVEQSPFNPRHKENRFFIKLKKKLILEILNDLVPIKFPSTSVTLWFSTPGRKPWTAPLCFLLDTFWWIPVFCLLFFFVLNLHRKMPACIKNTNPSPLVGQQCTCYNNRICKELWADLTAYHVPSMLLYQDLYFF